MSGTNSNSDELQTIAAVLAGDADRFASIVAAYEGVLRRVAESRLGHRDSAEEAVQETFLAAFRSLHTYNTRFSFRTWLWTILLNQCRRRQQRTRRRERLAPPAANPDAALAQVPGADRWQPEQIAMGQERTELLERLLRELPAVQADALRLRFFAGLPFQEIADSMQCSLSSAKNRVRHGLARLSNELTRLSAEGQEPCDANDILR